MKNIYRIATVALLGLVVSSCTYTAPGYATNNASIKEGIAERTIWFGITLGETDLSQTTAAKNGGITKIATVDYSATSRAFRTTYRTIVTGE